MSTPGAAEALDPTPPVPAETPPPAHSGFRRFMERVWSANAVTVSVLSIFFSMVVGGILICVSDAGVRATYGYFFAAPLDALEASWLAVSEAYENLFEGAFFDPDKFTDWQAGSKPFIEVFGPISETLTYAAPLILTGLSVAIAFRAGLFNIGGQGQAIIGVILAGLVGFKVDLPPVLHLIAVLLTAIVGGALWGALAGWLKARRGAHEVVTTIMLNYVALYLLGWMVLLDAVQDPTRTDAISRPVDADAMLPHLFGSSLRANVGILLAIAAAAGVAWLLGRSTAGFELRAVGSNPDAARTAGMSVAKAYILAMAVSGGLAGLGGSTVLLGTADGALTPSVVGNIGFDGIAVALLGRGKPWGVVLAGLLFGALRAGGIRMQSFSGIPVNMVDVLQAIIVLLIAAPLLVREIFRLRDARAGRFDASLAKGW